MPNSGYFDQVFGVDGSLTAVPDATQSNGSVSYQQGFPILYSTPVESGGYNFPRAQFNQLLNDITTAIQNWQQNAIPPFITSTMNGGSPYSYSVGNLVFYNGVAYQSLANSNTDTPPTANWKIFNIAALTAAADCYLSLSGSSLVLSPYSGNQLMINGVNQVIPSGGITLTTGGLSASTFYYIYAYMNSGTMTLVASATGYSIDAASGMPIKTGDATHTLVGVAYTTSGTAWADTSNERFVLSYFNRLNKHIEGTAVSAATTTSTSAVELSSGSRAQFICFGDEAYSFSCGGDAANSASGDVCTLLIGLDGVTSPTTDFSSTGTSAANNQIFSLTAGFNDVPTVGYHYATPVGYVGAGTGTFNVKLIGVIRG